MTQPHDYFADPEIPKRQTRFEGLFKAHDILATLINKILDEEGARMQVRDGDQRLLSMVVGTALARGMKDLQAVVGLCLLGFGEQAMIVLRSSVNLLINVNFITTDDHPLERTEEFFAFTYRELSKFMRESFGQDLKWAPPGTPEERKRKANAWEGRGIRRRAERLPTHHYNVGYRFYSSVEHADVAALLDMIEREDEAGPFLNSGPNDAKVEVVLQHAFMVFADLLNTVCKYYGIDRQDVFDELTRVSAQVAAETAQRKGVTDEGESATV